jgi:hypothetical protein
MPLVNPLLLGRYERWRAIPARTLAAAMRTAGQSGRLGRTSPHLAGAANAGAARDGGQAATVTRFAISTT